MAVGGLMVVDAGPGTTYAAILSRVAERIHLVPRFRQVARAGLVGFAPEAWTDDRHFDLSWHVRRVALPAPAGPAELDAFVGQEMSRRLDRDRPLWELSVIEGVAGGRVGLLAKLHHAVADGMAAIAASVLLLDPGPEPLEIPPPDADWSPRRYDARRHLLAMASGPVTRATRIGLEGAARARDASATAAVRDARRATELAAELARTRPQAPMTPLNQPLGPSRAFRSLTADLAVAQGGRQGRGRHGQRRAARGRGRDAASLLRGGGNRPRRQAPGRPGADLAATPRAGRRARQPDLDRVRRPSHRARRSGRTDHRRGQDHPRGQGLRRRPRRGPAGGGGGVTPPLLAGTVARAMGSVRVCNLVVSNLPGPQQPFYVSGQQLRGLFPLIPLNPGNQRLSVGILSYDGAVCFGLLADGALTPGVDAAAAALAVALDELGARP